MQINKQMGQSLLIIIVILSGFYFIQSYTSAESVWNRQEQTYKEELNTLSGSIESLRQERKEKESEWREVDNTLSWAINEAKSEVSALEMCIQNRSMDCAKPKDILPQTYAEQPKPTSWTAHDTPASVVPKRPICTIGTGSHDVRHLAPKYPWVAGWKNNNTSGISMGSKALEQAFNDAGIKWVVGTARPKNEWSHYYGFTDLENGMKAKMLIIKRSYLNSSISSFLRVWWTDSIPTYLDQSRKVSSLSDSEFLDLILLQIKKESGKAMYDYIINNVITCD